MGCLDMQLLLFLEEICGLCFVIGVFEIYII